MRILDTHSPRAALSLLIVAVVAVLFAAPAQAQVNPLWDHYKVYNQNLPAPAPAGMPPVLLTDQFGQFTHQVISLDRFMNPVIKIDGPIAYPINNPALHYSWWSITPQPFTATVAVTNQFGDQTLSVLNAQYLLNPAAKDTVPLPAAIQPPVANHYKAYNVQGQPVNITVGMIDQFDTWQATVLLPRYLLTPVAKQIVGGPNYPIVDANQHYVVYEFQPPDPTPRTAYMTDQFLSNQLMYLYPGQWICVPSTKQIITPTRQDTWGRLKKLYR